MCIDSGFIIMCAWMASTYLRRCCLVDVAVYLDGWSMIGFICCSSQQKTKKKHLNCSDQGGRCACVDEINGDSNSSPRLFFWLL